MTLDDLPGIVPKGRAPWNCASSTNSNAPWNCALSGFRVSRRARAITRLGEARDPSGRLSFITYKRFKRSECQLVNIIIMTSNMARSLHRNEVRSGDRNTVNARPDNCSPARRKMAIAVLFLCRINRCSAGIVVDWNVLSARFVPFKGINLSGDDQ